MGNLHHVNLSIPVGGEQAEAAFLTEILGYSRLPAPENLPMAKWFEFSDGTQIHLSEDEGHSPSEKAHVAMQLGSDLQVVAERLDAAGYEVANFDRPDVKVVFVKDPAGNRWELRQTLV